MQDFFHQQYLHPRVCSQRLDQTNQQHSSDRWGLRRSLFVNMKRVFIGLDQIVMIQNLCLFSWWFCTDSTMAFITMKNTIWIHLDEWATPNYITKGLDSIPQNEIRSFVDLIGEKMHPTVLWCATLSDKSSYLKWFVSNMNNLPNLFWLPHWCLIFQILNFLKAKRISFFGVKIQGSRDSFLPCAEHHSLR